MSRICELVGRGLAGGSGGGGRRRSARDLHGLRQHCRWQDHGARGAGAANLAGVRTQLLEALARLVKLVQLDQLEQLHLRVQHLGAHVDRVK